MVPSKKISAISPNPMAITAIKVRRQLRQTLRHAILKSFPIPFTSFMHM